MRRTKNESERRSCLAILYTMQHVKKKDVHIAHPFCLYNMNNYPQHKRKKEKNAGLFMQNFRIWFEVVQNS